MDFASTMEMLANYHGELTVTRDPRGIPATNYRVKAEKPFRCLWPDGHGFGFDVPNGTSQHTIGNALTATVMVYCRDARKRGMKPQWPEIWWPWMNDQSGDAVVLTVYRPDTTEGTP